MKICTVVVTYNRYSLLKECLDSLLNQTYPTDIFVIDNASTDGTKSNLMQDNYTSHPNIFYKNLDNNLGGAGGFYYGIKEAMGLNYDFIWLMDDDAEPKLDALEVLVTNIHTHPSYAAYAPQVRIGSKEVNTLSMFGHRGMFDYQHTLPSFQQKLPQNAFETPTYEIDMASFVGILIPFSSIEIIGLPKKEFFIHHDDTEYSLRLADIGKILLVNESLIYHKEQRQEEKILKQFLWKSKNRIRYDKLWLKFFGLRNSVWLAKKHSKSPWVYLEIWLLFFTLVKDILLYDDHKWLRLKFATHSVLDGLRGHFDNTKAKRLLHG